MQEKIPLVFNGAPLAVDLLLHHWKTELIACIYICCQQGWRQEFSDGGLTLPTSELRYGFQGTINTKNLGKNHVSPSDGGYHARMGIYSPIAFPCRHPWLQIAVSCWNAPLFYRNKVELAAFTGPANLNNCTFLVKFAVLGSVAFSWKAKHYTYNF